MNEKELKLNDFQKITLNCGEMEKLRRKYNIPENPHDTITSDLCSVIAMLEKQLREQRIEVDNMKYMLEQECEAKEEER